MDSWRCLSEGRNAWLSDDVDFTVDAHLRCKNEVMGYEIKPFSNVENNPFVSNTQDIERWDLMDLSFSDEIRKSYSISSETSGEVFGNEFGIESNGNIVSPFGNEKKWGSRISNDFMLSNNQNFSLVDLKLGSLVDGRGSKDSKLSKASIPAPSALSSHLAKRASSKTLYSPSPCCQAFGCEKDLRSGKGYYKRHKVCDVHAKAPKVVVNGIEQRFCQQCSRFHLLAEFDDDKRSCRRRLATHNQRRRKPQFTSESGSRIIGFSSSFASPEVQLSDVHGPGGARERKVGMAKATIQTSCALSLLSAQSHDTSSQLVGTTTMRTRMSTSSHGLGTTQYSFVADVVEPTTSNRSDGIVALTNTNFDRGTLGRGVVLDLLQLSSHLQRIEQQRHSTTQSEAR